MTDPIRVVAPDHGILIREAASADADAIGDLFLSAFHATYDFPLAHTDDEVRDWLRTVVAEPGAWVAVVGEAAVPGGSGDMVVGFMALVGHDLDQLYIRPGWWSRGIGSRLVEHAKLRSPEGLALWTFQVNARARRFYERHGFTVLMETDGTGNEERQPDVRYAWHPDTQSLRGWDGAYAGRPPWDIGRPQSAFSQLAASGGLQGRVLDVGCGTGEHTLMAPALGIDATGVDVAAPALAIARRKAAERGISARFVEWDATRLPVLGERWRTVLDCGVFHTFDDHARARYVASLTGVVEPGGRYHMLVFSDRQGGDLGPRRIHQEEIRAAFAEGWSILSIEPAILETNPGFDTDTGGSSPVGGAPTASGAGSAPASAGSSASGAAEVPPSSAGGLHGAQAWLSVIERR